MEVGRIRPRLRTYFYMYFPILLAWVTCLVCGRAEGKKPQNLPTYNLTCPSGQFYTPSSHSCAPCSVCSNNDVVRKPCSQTSDTVCGPFPAFKEFQFFHQDDTKSTKEASDGEMKSDSQVSAKKTEVHLTIYRSSDNPADGSDSQHWRIVAFSLIGALSALVFVATFVVLVVWRRFNHRVTRPPTPTDDDADCPYVLIHTIRPSCSSDDEVVYQVPPGPNALHQLARQRQRLFKYRPKRRLLPANEYADDVFESEDSAGSRRRTSLQAIPETGHSDTEAECSPASSQCPSSPADQRTQSSGSSGKAQSSGFSGHTQSSGSSTKVQSSGSSGQAQSSGSIEQTQSPGSSVQAQSSGSMEQTQSSGSSGQAQAFEFKDLLAGLSETVDPTTSSPVSSSACIVSGLRVTPQVESEHTDPPPSVCMESPRPAPSSGEALCV